MTYIDPQFADAITHWRPVAEQTPAHPLHPVGDGSLSDIVRDGVKPLFELGKGFNPVVRV